MRRSRRSPGLFEFIRGGPEEGPDALQVPSWWRKSGKPRHPVSPEISPNHAAMPPSRPSQESPAAPVSADSIGRRRGTGYRFSFSGGVGVGCLLAVVTLLAGTFWIGHYVGARAAYGEGRRSYEADTLSDIEAARRQPPDTDLVASLLVGGDETAVSLEDGATVSDGEVIWVAGNTYVLVQEFAADAMDDVERAQLYLSQRDIVTSRITLATGRCQLITAQGFNRSEAVQRKMADELLKRVHGVGASYYAAGGRYKMQGYFKKLVGKHW